MAKVTITFEDNGSNSVKVVAEPNFETMMMKHVSGHELTSAEGYAIAALNAIRLKAKDMEHQMKVPIPRLR